MGFADKCHLKIPFPAWAKDNKDDPSRDFENWKEVQRWADDFYTNCLPTGGGVSEAFAADSVGTTGSIIASLGSDSLEFRQSSTNLGRFRTTGISDISTASTSITLPAGLWMLTALITVEPDTTAPSSGYCDVQFDYINEYVRVPWSQISDPGSGDEIAMAWLHRLYHFSTASSIGFIVDNFTDVSIIAHCKMFEGVRHAAYGDLTLA